MLLDQHSVHDDGVVDNVLRTWKRFFKCSLVTRLGISPRPSGKARWEGWKGIVTDLKSRVSTMLAGVIRRGQGGRRTGRSGTPHTCERAHSGSCEITGDTGDEE